MRALCIRAPGQAEVIDAPRPVVHDGHVLLRVVRVGLCGSDLSTYLGENPMVSYPRIPGHEVGGVVEAVGSGVPRAWSAGMSVTLSPYAECGRCASCRAGRSNACRGNQTMGVQRDGALAEFVVVPHEKLYTSDALSLEALALVEPFAVGAHAVVRGRVRECDTVLVLGCGAVGLGAIAAAASRGARVIAADIHAPKLDLAKRLGACETLNAASGSPEERITELTDGEGPAVVIEAAGTPATYRMAVDVAAFCGRVVCIGYAQEEVAYATKLFVAKELDILGSRNALDEFGDVIASFEAGAYDPLALVTHRVSLDDVPGVLDDWRTDRASVTKVMVEMT